MPMFVVGTAVHGQIISINISRTQVEADSESFVDISADEVVADEELRVYALGAIRSDGGVQEMNFTGKSVEVMYKQKGHLLALIPITFTVRATAHADGSVELDYPWYSAITIDNKQEVETELKIAVDNTLSARYVGSVRAEGPEATELTAAESAQIASAMHSVLKSKLDNQKTGD